MSFAKHEFYKVNFIKKQNDAKINSWKPSTFSKPTCNLASYFTHPLLC